MSLDLPTLLVALTVVSASMAVAVLAVAWRAHIRQGLALWGLGLAINTLSYPAFALRVVGWPHISILLSNLFTGLPLVLFTMALASFHGVHTRRLPVWALWTPLGLNMVAAALLLNDDHWRNILVAAAQSLITLMLLRQAWDPGLIGSRPTGRRVVTAGAAILLVTLVIRTAFMAFTSDWDGKYLVPDSVQVATYLPIMAVLLINSMGFVLMQMERAIDQQRMLATHDGLTGLYNRTALLELLTQYSAQSRRQNVPMAFLMLDIDHFKRVNDEHGHLAGDEVLREVAGRIQQRLRQSDILARYGGEEFLALLPATDGAGAQSVAEDIRQAIAARPIASHGAQISITISIGVHAGVPGIATNAVEAMIDRSDQALYQAKTSGRNRVVVA